jgi:hypothetical protein
MAQLECDKCGRTFYWCQCHALVEWIRNADYDAGE